MGKLKIRLKLNNNEIDSSIRLRLTAPDGKIIYDDSLTLTDSGEYKFSEELKFDHILQWSHEEPNLYEAILIVENNKGEVLEVVPYKIGFRELELKDGVIYLNKERLFIKGVNRHEWNPNKGRAINQQDMDNDMKVILDNNINAVRTSHYPNQSHWYELCDKNGIYLIDETNLETHGSWMKLMKVDPDWNVPGDLPEWKENVLDRARSMFERDKNHPSILFWSVGNESYAGSNLMAMADYFREQDPSRLVHYEGSFHNREWNDISDVESQMYPSPEDVQAYLEDNPTKPIILCEFMHNMGNSMGGLESYMKLGEKYEMYQGGFIWDFKDQALWKKDKHGNCYLAYGGDFGERQSDYNFSGNGIVSADLEEKPAMQEIKYWYGPEEERKQLARNRKYLKDIALKSRDEKIEKMLNSPDYPPLNIVQGDGAYGVHGKDFSILFSIPHGGPVSLRKKKKEWLWRAPVPAFWRAPTENDVGNSFAQKSAIWQAVENSLSTRDIKVLDSSDDKFVIKYTYGSPVNSSLNVSVIYTVYRSGLIRVNLNADIPDDMPEAALFGLRFESFEDVERFKWTGLDNETYPDRKGGRFGTFSGKPEIGNYLVPQEMGNHTETLYVELTDQEQEKLEIYCDEKPFNFSVLPNTPNELQEAFHKFELPQSVRSVITISGFMRGVGGIDSWGSDVEEDYRLTQKEMAFSFYLK